MNELFLKILMVELCDSSVRNINDNFISISFDIVDTNVSVKMILDTISEKESEYIDDIITEFEATQESDIIKNVIITTDLNCEPFPYVIYSRED